jgi:thiosulfate/3-mercaptopyruvate sulfurtransferase
VALGRRQRLGLLLLLVPALTRADALFEYVSGVDTASGDDLIVLDTRPLAACVERTLAGAHCLPAADLLGPHRRLPSFHDLLWVFGTVGLTGNETVLVVGERAGERDFVAGLLFLAGQARVRVLGEPLRAAALEGRPTAPGRQRGNTRRAVFQATLRDDLLVLTHELAAQLASAAPPPLLDGRGEAEYWGERVRGLRGGHLPGARHLAASAVRADLAAGRLPVLADAGEAVAYGHDAVESVAYLTLLRAGAGFDASVYLDGFAAWAATTDLPLDSLTLPERPAPVAVPPPATAPAPWPAALAGALAGALLVLIGYLLAARRRAACN